MCFCFFGFVVVLLFFYFLFVSEKFRCIKCLNKNNNYVYCICSIIYIGFEVDLIC